jgi:hypothetical protein
VPERRADSEELADHAVRDQRRWGLVALLLIVGLGAAAGQAAARRR